MLVVFFSICSYSPPRARQHQLLVLIIVAQILLPEFFYFLHEIYKHFSCLSLLFSHVFFPQVQVSDLHEDIAVDVS